MESETLNLLGRLTIGFAFPGSHFPDARESRSFSIPKFPGMEQSRSRDNGNGAADGIAVIYRRGLLF